MNHEPHCECCACAWRKINSDPPHPLYRPGFIGLEESERRHAAWQAKLAERCAPEAA